MCVGGKPVDQEVAHERGKQVSANSTQEADGEAFQWSSLVNQRSGCAGTMSSVQPLVKAPRTSAPSDAAQDTNGSSPEQRAREEISLEDSQQGHEHGKYEHESAPPERTTNKEKVDGATTAKDLPCAMHVLTPVPRKSRGVHGR